MGAGKHALIEAAGEVKRLMTIAFVDANGPSGPGCTIPAARTVLARVMLFDQALEESVELLVIDDNGRGSGIVIIEDHVFRITASGIEAGARGAAVPCRPRRDRGQ